MARLNLQDDPRPDLAQTYQHCPCCGRNLRWDVVERAMAYDDDGELYEEVTANAGRCTNRRCRVEQVGIEFKSAD